MDRQVFDLYQSCRPITRSSDVTSSSDISAVLSMWDAAIRASNASVKVFDRAIHPAHAKLDKFMTDTDKYWFEVRSAEPLLSHR